MRIGEFGGVLAIQNVRGRRGDEGGRVGSVRVAYWVRSWMMKRLRKRRRKHPGGSESGISIGIERGSENMG
jgi:hypothetical protein